MQGIVKEDIRTSTKCVEARSTENAISAINDAIAEKIGQQKFRIWFKNSTRLTLSDGLLKIGVINPFIASWLESHFSIQVTESVRAVAGASCQVCFIVDPQLCDSRRPATFDWQAKPALNSPITVESGRGITQRPTYAGQKLKLTFDTFVVGQSNELAYNAAKAVINDKQSPFNPLFIHGGYGLGKTHLLHAIGNHIRKNNPTLRVLYVTSEKFINEFIDSLRFEKPASFRNKYRNLDCLLIDDIQFLVGRQSSQEEFFYTFNTLYDSHKQVVITSDRPPKELPTLEPRLISRFEWGVIADIQPPDLETRIAIMRKKAEEERLYIPDDVVLYIATQIKSNIRELEGSLLRITAFSAFTGTPLTVDSVQKILKDVVRPPEDAAPVTIDKIQKVVARHFNLEFKDMKSKRRTDAVAFPRQIAMYLARTLTDEFSTTDIGDAFGGKDHTTVMHACNKIKARMATDPYFVAKINQISQDIRTEKE